MCKVLVSNRTALYLHYSAFSDTMVMHLFYFMCIFILVQLPPIDLKKKNINNHKKLTASLI